MNRGGEGSAAADRICPFMSHRGGEVEIVFYYREGCAAWKAHRPHGHGSEAGPDGYCVRIWGTE